MLLEILYEDDKKANLYARVVYRLFPDPTNVKKPYSALTPREFRLPTHIPCTSSGIHVTSITGPMYTLLAQTR